jgi:hypothetical protein
MHVVDLLNYDPETGLFTWKESGEVAGFKNRNGYVFIKVGGMSGIEYAHRLAYEFMGEDVPELVDHINGIKHDNRWCNLRPANKVDNACNAKIRQDNKTGYKGVSWCSRRECWRVSVTYNKKTVSKRFKDFDEAVSYMEELRKELHRDYSRFK